MKNLAFLSLLAMLMIVWVSCGEDDNRPAPGQEQADVEMIFSGINVQANYQDVTPPTQNKKLTDVLSSTNKNKSQYVNKAEIQYSNTYITVQGEGFNTLKKITVKLLDGPSMNASVVYSYDINLNSSDSDGINDSTNPCLIFLNNIANYLATKKTMYVQVTLNAGNQDINGLKVTLHTTAIFSW